MSQVPRNFTKLAFKKLQVNNFLLVNVMLLKRGIRVENGIGIVGFSFLEE